MGQRLVEMNWRAGGRDIIIGSHLRWQGFGHGPLLLCPPFCWPIHDCTDAQLTRIDGWREKESSSHRLLCDPPDHEASKEMLVSKSVRVLCDRLGA